MHSATSTLLRDVDSGGLLFKIAHLSSYVWVVDQQWAENIVSKPLSHTLYAI